MRLERGIIVDSKGDKNRLYLCRCCYNSYIRGEMSQDNPFLCKRCEMANRIKSKNKKRRR